MQLFIYYNCMRLAERADARAATFRADARTSAARTVCLFPEDVAGVGWTGRES